MVTKSFEKNFPYKSPSVNRIKIMVLYITPDSTTYVITVTYKTATSTFRKGPASAIQFFTLIKFCDIYRVANLAAAVIVLEVLHALKYVI